MKFYNKEFKILLETQYKNINLVLPKKKKVFENPNETPVH